MTPRYRIPPSLVVIAVSMLVMVIDTTFTGLLTTQRLLVYIGAAIFLVVLLESLPQRRVVRLRARRRRRGQCEACGYDLRGADHNACPECGTAIE